MPSTAIRRSARNAARNLAETYKEVDSDCESDESQQSDQSDYEEANTSSKTTKKRSRKSAIKPSAKRTKTTKSGKISKTSLAKRTKNLDQLEAELVENHLYQALAQPEVDISDLALEWVDSYVEDAEENSNESVTVLINLLLRSCGSLHLFQPHDLVNLESAGETVGELVIAFTEQQSHKYPFKALPIFRKNVLSFFEQTIQVCHEKGLLYNYEHNDEDEQEESSLSSPLMSQILTWISSLSSCTIRPLRYTSTVVLLTIQNQLCHVINNVITALDKAQKQLSRTKKTAKSKYESVSKTVQSYHNQKNTIIEYFNEIGNITLGHRYRDIDPLIRQECLKHVSQAMIIYPDHFFQASFLRYFGWLLSDPTNAVRIEVTKVLLKLYKVSHSNLGIGFRQFTERYKKQIIKMSRIDSDVNVRFNAIGICCELQNIGYFEEHDNLEIISIFFEIILDSKSISKVNSHRMRAELAKFLSILNEQFVKEQLEKFSMFTRNYESKQFGDEEGQLKIRDCLKIKSLISILKNTTSFYLGAVHKTESAEKIAADLKAKNVISIIFSILYQLPYYANTWEFLIRYLLLDSSSIKFSPVEGSEFGEDNQEVEEFKSIIDLSKDERLNRLYLLNFIDGAFNNLIATKSKQEELSSVILVRLVSYLPKIQSISIKYPDPLTVFLKLWNLLIGVPLDTLNFFSIFNSLNQTQTYNDINKELLKFYKNYEFVEENDSDLLQQFDLLFGKLLEHYDGQAGSINVLTSENKLQIQDFIRELIEEVKIGTNNRSDFEEDEEDGLRVQRNIVENVAQISQPILKLRRLGDAIDLNEFFDTTLVDHIVFKLLNRFDVSLLTHQWRNNLIANFNSLISGTKDILDLILILLSWKLEKLIKLESHESAQSEVDIEVEFAYTNEVVNALLKNISAIDSTIKEIADQEDNKILTHLNDLKTVYAVKLIDLLVSIKIFYIKFDSTKNNFRNFEDYFGNMEEMGKYITRIIPSDVQYQLLESFLYKEARLASVRDVDLDRGDEEDVNYNDLVREDDENGVNSSRSKSVFDDSDSDADEEQSSNTQKKADSDKVAAEKQQKQWQYEKDLCVYTVKLFSLINTLMVNQFIADRIKLNSEKFGGVFLKIVQQNEQQQEKESTALVEAPSEDVPEPEPRNVEVGSVNREPVASV
ncbi:uncharacterized protein RJT20DRAFT_64835 [Scheffersomyces xylosifermentans]|uniref:uncharacterized protein n=1 Tax=Scheffersomyces xylosifermentans TaxID=1304137 RepID=UPI00315D9E99